MGDFNAEMVNVGPLSDHVGYHLLHWVISQSGAWYSKVNENLQDNLRSLETGVAVIDDILTPREEESPFDNQQHVEASPRYAPPNDHGHHIDILNQIINMNINYNDGSIEQQYRTRNFRGNSPQGLFTRALDFTVIESEGILGKFRKHVDRRVC